MISPKFFLLKILMILLLSGNFVYGNNLIDIDPPRSSKPLPIIQSSDTIPSIYINTAFENGSPLNWEIGADGTVLIQLQKEHQRFSGNSSAGHCYFELFAPSGTDVKIEIQPIDVIYKGRKAHLFTGGRDTIRLVSTDRKHWETLRAKQTKDSTLQFTVHMKERSMFIAEIIPYTPGDLSSFLSEIKPDPRVKIDVIGKTFEDRPLQMVRVGSPNAPNIIFIRARAHAFESGGNYLVEGLIRKLLKNDPESIDALKKYCLYVLPMANIDGVARGQTRYNAAGMDLNRNWFDLAEPAFAPENYYLEMWIRSMIYNNMKPDLAIDIHNDLWGWLHTSRPPQVDLTEYLMNMNRLDNLIRVHTWYNYGITGPDFRDEGAMAEGFLANYGIDAITLELKYDRDKNLQKTPLAYEYNLLGSQFVKVFNQYF